MHSAPSDLHILYRKMKQQIPTAVELASIVSHAKFAHTFAVMLVAFLACQPMRKIVCKYITLLIVCCYLFMFAVTRSYEKGDAGGIILIK